MPWDDEIDEPLGPPLGLETYDDAGNVEPHDLGEVDRSDEMTDEDPVPAAPEPEIEIPAPLQEEASFLCGPAGTGKTFLSLAMARQLPGTILAASTGIAACNLGEGCTINSLLGYFDTASLRENFISGRLTSKLAKLAKSGVKLIILDEISMVDGDQLTIITRALRELHPDSSDDPVDAEAYSLKKNKVILPPRLMLVGDFCQLPPVKAPFAFESKEWPAYFANSHQLTTIRRQADLDFITALQAARRGDVRTVVDYFGPRMVRNQEFKFEGTSIYAKNEEVDRFNTLRLDELTTREETFYSERWGAEPGDWRNIPQHLMLKVGARIMILVNLREYGARKLVYANGDLGTVVSMEPDRNRIVVTLDRNGRDVVVEYNVRQNKIPLESGRRKALTEAGHPERVIEDKWERIGEVKDLPVRLAYATTVHKSQGLSLDKVQVNTGSGMFQQPGLLYVALSRVRTAEGLRLVGTVDGLARRCTVHPKVRPWL